jgi:hypothetical protein
MITFVTVLGFVVTIDTFYIGWLHAKINDAKARAEAGKDGAP